MNARLIHAGEVTAGMKSALYELPKVIDIKTPLILTLGHQDDTLTIYGSGLFSQYVNRTEGFSLCRVPYHSRTGVTFTDKDSVIVRFYLPKKNTDIVEAAFFEAIEAVLKTYGVTAYRSKHRPDSNDVVFEKDGRTKKFCGLINNKDEGIFSFLLTFNFDAEKVKDLYRLDTPKFKSRGTVSDITEVVGGLREANPSIGDEVAVKIIEAMVGILGWSLQGRHLSEPEYSKFEELSKQFSTDDWILQAKR